MKPIEITREKIHQMPMDITCLGKWCFVYNRYFYGFFETKEEAITHIQNFNPDHYVERSRYVFTLRDKVLPYEDSPLGAYPLLHESVRSVLVSAIA